MLILVTRVAMRSSMARNGSDGTEGAPSFDEKAFANIYRSRFAEFHLAWTIFFLQHMSMLRRHFDDLEDALLLAAFGLAPLAEAVKLHRGSQQAMDIAYGKIRLPVRAATNAVRLAELTGIPRQTVRRKLQSFVRKGWVEQHTDRSWHLATHPDKSTALANDMAALNMAFLHQLARLLTQFDHLLDEGAAETGVRRRTRSSSAVDGGKRPMAGKPMAQRARLRPREA